MQPFIPAIIVTAVIVLGLIIKEMKVRKVYRKCEEADQRMYAQLHVARQNRMQREY